MARTKEARIGHLHGLDAQVAPAQVRVFKAGRAYRITHRDVRNLCHPSLRSIDKVKAEVLLVFQVKAESYEAI